MVRTNYLYQQMRTIASKNYFFKVPCTLTSLDFDERCWSLSKTRQGLPMKIAFVG